jgi:hypothetical protein
MGKGARIDRCALAALPVALQRRVTRLWLRRALGITPGFAQVERALACLGAPNRTRTAPLLRGRCVEVQGEWLVLRDG